MLTIYTRISASRQYHKALLWRGTAEDGIIHARYDATLNGLGRVVAAYVLDERGRCVGVWNIDDGFQHRGDVTLDTLNDFA